MNSTHRIVAIGLAASFCLEALGAGSHVLPVSPPPCAPDGSCYPKPATWGHYGTHWRPWPGASANTPTPRTPEGSLLLDPASPPPPEQEEQHAPPPLPTSDAEEDEGPTPPVDTPPLNLPPLPFQTPPGSEPPSQPGTTPPATRPGPEGSTPPPLPFPSAPGTTPAPSTLPFPGTQGAPARPNEVPLSPPGSQFQQPMRVRPSTANQDDAPPALPLHFTQRGESSLRVASEQPSLRRLPTAPVATGTNRGVVNAAASMPASARHQAQPASYTPESNNPPPALPSFLQ